MKKLLLLLMLASTVAQAQDEFKNIVQISGGISMPQGGFANTNGSDAGSATIGAIIDLGYQHRMGDSKFWLAGSLRHQAWTYDTQGSSVTASNWSAQSFLAGGIYSIKLGGKVYFEPKAMLGLMIAKSPQFTGSSATIESVSATTVTYMIAPNFRFDLWKRISLFLNMDYMSAKPKFDVDVPGIGIQTTSQPMANINIAGGVGFRF